MNKNFELKARLDNVEDIFIDQTFLKLLLEMLSKGFGPNSNL